MKKIQIFLIALILTSCEVFNPTEFKVQEELKPYVESFYREAKLRGHNPPRNNAIITISDLSSKCKCNGLTTYNPGGAWTDNPQVWIEINKAYFEKSDSARIAFTVFHELGHGVLKRFHINTWSIMNPGINRDKIDKETIDELYRY